MGLSTTTTFTIFAKKVSHKNRIPFEVSADPFYDEKNMLQIMRAIDNLNTGKGIEHDIIEVDK